MGETVAYREMDKSCQVVVFTHSKIKPINDQSKCIKDLCVAMWKQEESRPTELAAFLLTAMFDSVHKLPT